MLARTDVLILGGGVSGLACRAGLGDRRSSLLLEKDHQLGGLLRVYPAGDYTFDTTVHVLFFKNPSLKRAILALLPQGAHCFERRNLVWQSGTTLPYPYQFNAHALPTPIREDCLARFLDNPCAGTSPDDFRGWLLSQFGAGFFEHFFGPYNRKLYGVPLDSLEAAPMLWLIPSDNRQAVQRGAHGPIQAPPTTCYYPRGPQGIHAVPEGLLALSDAPVLRGQEVKHIDPTQRRVTTSTGLQVQYRELVSSLPLPVLLGLIDTLPDTLRQRARALEAQSVTMVHIGTRSASAALPAHWTYFPDPEVPFYRLTRLEEITPDMCPQGGQALMLECPGSPAPDRDEVVRTLIAIGVIEAPEDIEHYRTLTIPFAYVLFIHGFREILADARAWLASCGIHTMGRYGAWEYLNIERTIESGLEVAKTLLNDARRPTWPALEDASP